MLAWFEFTCPKSNSSDFKLKHFYPSRSGVSRMTLDFGAMC